MDKNKVIFNPTAAALAIFETASVTTSETPSSAVPTAPTIAAVDAETGTSVTVTFSASASGVTNYVYYKKRTASTWTAGLSRSGDGVVTQTGLTESLYDIIGISEKSGLYSLPSNQVSVTVTDGVDDPLADLVVAFLNSETFSQEFTATKTFDGKLKRTDLSGLNVQVMHVATEPEPMTRELIRYRAEVQIGIRVNISDREDIEDYKTLACEIESAISGEVLDSKYNCTETEIDPVYEPNLLATDNIFLSVIKAYFLWAEVNA